MQKVLIPFLGVLALVYAMQINSPVRLNTDAIVYLNSSHTAATGQGYMYLGRESKYPTGYPFMVSSMERIGIANSYTLMGLNLVFLSLGLWMTFLISRYVLLLSNTESAGVIVLSMLSYVVIKNSALPMSDTVAFGLSMMSLCAIVMSERQRGWNTAILLGVAFVFALAAMNTRTIYVSLFPAIAFSTFYAISNKITIAPRWSRVVFGLTAVAVVIAAFFLLERVLSSKQLNTMVNAYGTVGVGTMLGQVLFGTTLEWGQILLNVPVGKLVGLGASWLGAQLTLGFVGTLTITGFFVAMWNRRRQFGSLEIYILAYSGMLVIWPSRDPRLWLGLIPLLIAYAIPLVKTLLTMRFTRPLITIYLTVFVLIGTVGIGINTRVSFSGSEFPNVYGDGTMTDVYDAVYRGTALPETAGDTDIDSMVRVLRAYESRVHESFRNDSTYDQPVPLRPRKAD